VCINNEDKCPINKIRLYDTDKTPSSVPNKNRVRFGANRDLVFTSDTDALPITQVNLEIDKPCFQSKFYASGVANEDSSIYQIYEFNHFFEPWEPSR